jgi:predicted transcriptional regulator
MKYLSRTDIIAKILDSASNEPISKTRLMYQVCMPHEQITSYASMLIERDLLTFDNYASLFSTTAKGLKFLELYNEMQQLYNKRSYLQNQLKSFGIELKEKKLNNNELWDHKELENLAGVLKQLIYQDYKPAAYSKQGTKHREESNTINI